MSTVLLLLLFVAWFDVSLSQPQSLILQQSAGPISSWTGVSSSASGQYFVAVTDSAVYLSEDYGYFWFAVLFDEILTGVASSASGQYIYVVQSSGKVYTSENFGASYRETSVGNDLLAISCSSSGIFSYAISQSSVYMSDSVGNGYTKVFGSSNLVSICCSSTGQYVYVASGNGLLYASSDYGYSFNITAEGNVWSKIVAGSTGQYVVGAVSNGGILVSTNYGLSFTSSNAPYRQWTSLAISNSSQYMYAVGFESGMYYSENFGMTWSLSGSPVASWTAIATSYFGTYIVAGISEGGIYSNFLSPTSQPSASPSSQPSSYPSYIPDTLNKRVVVTSYQASSTYTFNNLGCGTEAFLSASIIVSYLAASSSGYISIAAGVGNNTKTIAASCAPIALCSEVACAVNINVSSVLTCEGGGSLVITAATVNSSQETGIDTLCTYKGEAGLMYAISYTISVVPQPTVQPTVMPTVEGVGDLVFEASPNTPFFIISAVILLFVGLGVSIMRLKDKSRLYVDLSLTSTCVDLGMIGYHLSSEVFYLVVLFSEGLQEYAAVILSLRVMSILPSIYFVYLTFGEVYGAILNKSLMFKNAPTFSVVAVLMFLDQSLIRFFPWTESLFTRQSGGFPDQHVFTICMASKFAQVLAALAVQVVILAQRDSSIFTGRPDSIALILVALYFASSVLSVLLFAVTTLMRIRLAQSSDSNETRESNAENPMVIGVNTEMSTIRGKDINEKIAILDEKERLLTARMIELERKELQWNTRIATLEMQLKK